MKFNSEWLFYNFLYFKVYLMKWLSSIYRFFIQTKNVTIYNNGIKHNIFIRYLIIRILNSFIIILKNFRNLFDVEVDKIQIIKNYYNGNKTMIIDSIKHYNNKITIKDVINYIHKKENIKNDLLGNKIFMKFELNNKNKKICLKKYILIYKDYKKEYHNTLNNILLFNDININDDDETVIILKFFKDGKIHDKEIKYESIKNKHINYFYNM